MKRFRLLFIVIHWYLLRGSGVDQERGRTDSGLRRPATVVDEYGRARGRRGAQRPHELGRLMTAPS
eukprot:5207885-Pyramimonas_sp.AAC.1